MTRLRIGAFSALPVSHEEDYALREGVLTLQMEDKTITLVDAHDREAHTYAETPQAPPIGIVSEQELGVDAHATDPAQDLLVTCTGWGWKLTEDTRGMEYRFHMQLLSRKDHPHPWAHDVEVIIPTKVLRSDEKAFRPVIRIAGGIVGVQINQGNSSLAADFYFFNWRWGGVPMVIYAREQYISFVFLTETLVLLAHPHGTRHTKGCPSLDVWEFAGETLKLLRAYQLPCLKATNLLRDMQLHADTPASTVGSSCAIAVDMWHRAITEEGAEPEYVQTVFVISRKRLRTRVTRARGKVNVSKMPWKKWGPGNVCIFSVYAGNLPEVHDVETMQPCAVRGLSIVGDAMYFCSSSVEDHDDKCVRVVRTFIAQFKDSVPSVSGTTGQMASEQDGCHRIPLSESRLPAAGPGSPFHDDIATRMPCVLYQYTRLVTTNSDILLGGADGRFLFYTRCKSQSGIEEWVLDLLRYRPLKRVQNTILKIPPTEEEHTTVARCSEIGTRGPPSPKGQQLSHNENSSHVDDKSDPKVREQPFRDLRAANASLKPGAAPSTPSLPRQPLSPRRAAPSIQSARAQPALPSTEDRPSGVPSLLSEARQHVQLELQSAQPLAPGPLGFVDQSAWFTEGKPQLPGEETP